MHSPDVAKTVLRLWDSGHYTRAQIVKWFAHHYKGGYHIPHPTVSNIIKTAAERRAEHHDVDKMTAIALGIEIPKSKPVEEKPPIENRMSVVLAIPDLHCPFEHPDALAFLKLVRDTYRPTHIVCLGDEIDAHALSKYPKDPDGLTAGKELKEAIEHLQPFYVQFPEVKVCESNHTIRGWKLAFQAGLPKAFLRTVETVLNAPDGWTWAHRHIIDDVVYMHGDSGCSGFTAHINYMRKLKKSCVIGHIHSFAGVNYEGHLFGANSGCLIDVEAYCFKYAKGMPIPVSLGCSIIKAGKSAQFIPMHTDENGRWTGEL